MPVVGDEIDLLGQLTGGCEPGLFSGHVEKAGGQLPHMTRRSVAVLPDEQHLLDAPHLSQGQDRDRAGVLDVVAGDDAAPTEVHPVAPDAEDQPVEDQLRLEDRLARPLLDDVGATASWRTQAHPGQSASRTAEAQAN
ncbi:hypothetical protein GCM10027053_36910 [Intrasporangium mesophilum]